MARTLLLLAVVLVVAVAGLHGASAAYCHGKPSPNAQPNTYPILSDAPVFINATTNGKLFSAGQRNSTFFYVLHVYGTPYEQGVAQGQLLGQFVQDFVNQVWAYVQQEAIQSSFLEKLPAWLADAIIKFGLDVALDLTLDLTKDFTSPFIFDELRGIVDGAQAPQLYQTLVRLHMIPELTKGACSMYGAWGAATQHGNGGVMQLRALDWDTTGPFKDFPVITVYHPLNATYGVGAYANPGFAGWTGSFSGMSSSQLAISEIGVSFPDATFGYESRIGIPFVFLLRDIVQYCQTLDDAINMITGAHRTCDLILGVGDGKLGYMRGFEYSYSVADVMDDENMRPVNDTWHPRIPNIVYYGMDWLCPGYSAVLARQLQANYGLLDIPTTVRNITAIVQTGDLQVCVYDLTNQQMAVAYAAPSWQTDLPLNAYDRQFVQLDMAALWAEPAPTA